MRDEMFRFETAEFLVVASIEPECEPYDGDDDGETQEAIDNGELMMFATTVRVIHKASGLTLGRDDLGMSVYRDPREFFSGHRDPDPKNRNVLGQAYSVCHYFPEMVRNAIGEARVRKGLIAGLQLHA